MPRVKYIKSDIELLARIMRAEALGEGNLGMLMVGNVIVNRVFFIYSFTLKSVSLNRISECSISANSFSLLIHPAI